MFEIMLEVQEIAWNFSLIMNILPFWNNCICIYIYSLKIIVPYIILKILFKSYIYNIRFSSEVASSNEDKSVDVRRLIDFFFKFLEPR